MSYVKITFKEIEKAITLIHEETTKDNDYTGMFTYLNAAIEIRERMSEIDQDISQLWNEIIVDLVGSIYLASSGFYRSAITILRNIFELGCVSIFYFDHKIEFHMFRKENAKADKYVSTLVNEFDFFTTKYISAFYSDIKGKQTNEDSVSNYLKNLYIRLSDNVHGRYSSLTKTAELEVSYQKPLFKRYERLFKEILSILILLYVIRFNITDDLELIQLAANCKVVNL